jgi:hypothetical protein
MGMLARQKKPGLTLRWAPVSANAPAWRGYQPRRAARVGVPA